MKRFCALLVCAALAGCSSLQNPFTGGSSNYALLQAICSTPMVAANPEFALACAAAGLLNPSPMPVPAPVLK